MLYPNPASTEVFVNIDDNSAYPDANVTIWDINGRKIAEQKVTKEQHRIDVSALEAGVYLFEITYNEKKTTKRIIKHK